MDGTPTLPSGTNSTPESTEKSPITVEEALTMNPTLDVGRINVGSPVISHTMSEAAPPPSSSVHITFPLESVVNAPPLAKPEQSKGVN